jgi:hypothetical protein
VRTVPFAEFVEICLQAYRPCDASHLRPLHRFKTTISSLLSAKKPRRNPCAYDGAVVFIVLVICLAGDTVRILAQYKSRHSFTSFDQQEYNPVSKTPKQSGAVSRREFVQRCAVGAMALASAPIAGCRSASPGRMARRTGPASRMIPLDQDWLFGGKFDPVAIARDFDDASFSRISLPH